MSNVKYVFNPFTGDFDSIKTQDSVPSIVLENRNCDISVAVGDLVVESETVVNGVDAVSDNTDIRPVFAIVIKKVSDTICNVLIVGTVGGLAGLTKARKVFLSTTGTIGSTVVATGYLQCLGNARDVDTVDFNPQLNRVLRV
jgi:hypothetical protein